MSKFREQIFLTLLNKRQGSIDKINFEIVIKKAIEVEELYNKKIPQETGFY